MREPPSVIHTGCCGRSLFASYDPCLSFFIKEAPLYLGQTCDPPKGYIFQLPSWVWPCDQVLANELKEELLSDTPHEQGQVCLCALCFQPAWKVDAMAGPPITVCVMRTGVIIGTVEQRTSESHVPADTCRVALPFLDCLPPKLFCERENEISIWDKLLSFRIFCHLQVNWILAVLLCCLWASAAAAAANELVASLAAPGRRGPGAALKSTVTAEPKPLSLLDTKWDFQMVVQGKWIKIPFLFLATQ